MGLRGPKPTPTAILAQRGSWRAKERAGEPEGGELHVVPACPKGLPKDAARIWRQEAPVLLGMGVLTAGDLRTFERYCRTYALWRKIMSSLESAELITERMMKSLTAADNALRRLEASFGRSPADRAGMKIPAPKKPDASDPFRKPKLVS